ncbi:MAG: TetR/AcrR family transcriptional regulator [Patulibacter minatonensis]
MTTARRTHAERQRDAEDRLTQALAELIAEQGYERTTAAQIGERAGYSRAAVRDRYDSKDGLLLALHERYERLLLGDDPASAPTTLAEFFARLSAFATQHPEWLRAIFIVSFESLGAANDAFAPTVHRWVAALDEVALRLLRVEQEAGRVRADLDLDVYVPRAVEGLVGAAFRWCLSGTPESGAAFIESRIASAVADLAPPT